MRDKLKGIAESDYWVYGLREEDFDYTMRLAQEFVRAREIVLQHEIERTRRESPEEADDILDDEIYYTYVEIDYLWHFCLWRLQAVFEGLIMSRLLREHSDKRLMGIGAKLNALRKAGYTVEDCDFDELMSWAQLRNALSHAPPEQFRPGPLTESDVCEYRDLVGRLFAHWRQQSEQMSGQ